MKNKWYILSTVKVGSGGNVAFTSSYLNSKISLFLFHMYKCFVFIYICAPYACLVPTEVRRPWAHGTRVIEDCKQVCRFWEQCLGPLWEQQVPSTTEPLIFLHFLLRQSTNVFKWKQVCTYILKYHTDHY